MPEYFSKTSLNDHSVYWGGVRGWGGGWVGVGWGGWGVIGLAGTSAMWVMVRLSGVAFFEVWIRWIRTHP